MLLSPVAGEKCGLTQYTYDAKKVTQITKAGDGCQTVTVTYDTNTIVPGFSLNINDQLAVVTYYANRIQGPASTGSSVALKRAAPRP